MPTAVITGCNSGLGYCFAQLALKHGYKTYATSRTDGEKLQQLKAAGAETATFDISSIESIVEFKRILGDQPVDLFINNAGITAGFKAETLAGITPEAFDNVIRTNLTGPMFLTQSLLPNLLADRAADSPVRQIALISSRAGSIGDNTSGGVYAYRASKAGLNMMGRSLAVDLKDKGIAVSLHHPGIINTTGFVHGDNPLAVSAEFATGKCWEVMMKVDLDNTGRFWHRDGYELPW